MDMVRAGITLYGLWPSDEVLKTQIELRPVMSLKSHISFIKTVEAGCPVSYGGTYVTAETSRIATIPVGYADGYARAAWTSLWWMYRKYLRQSRGMLLHF